MEETRQRREQEEEEETVGVALRGRQSRRRLSKKATASAAANNNGGTVSSSQLSDSNGGTMATSEPAVETKSPIQDQQSPTDDLLNGEGHGNGAAIDAREGMEEVNGLERLDKSSIYYEQDEGSVSTHGFSGMEQSDICCSASVKHPVDNGLDVTGKNLDIQESLSNAIRPQCKENLRENVLSSFSHPPEKSLEEHNTIHGSLNDETVEHADTDLIKKSYKEVTDFDVETVLEKQDTHDLYCPNCNSCITKRVILRKRKRKIRSLDEDAKRNRLEAGSHSELDAISPHITNEQSHDARDICLDHSATPAATDTKHDSEPEVFRCLSCFSLFISTGNGFKLFRMFGDKNEKKNLQSPQQKPAMSKNWFFSIFSSKTGEMISEQDVEEDNVEVRIRPPDSNAQYIQDSSVQEASSPAQLIDIEGLVKSSGTGLWKSENETVHSSARAPLIHADVIVDGREKLDNTARKGSDAAYSSEVNEHTVIAAEVDIHREDPLKANGNAIILPVQDILSHQDRQVNNRDDMKDMPAKSSADLNCPSEVSQQTVIGNKVVIHTETPLKADVDGLIPPLQDVLFLKDTKIDIYSDLKDMHAGGNVDNDTIITVEALAEPPVSQGAESITSSAETETLPHTGTQINVGDQVSTEVGEGSGLEIIKSMVYGGLVESVTSLSVVSSAAGADAATLNVLALGLANLFGGLFIIGHNLLELKSNQSGNASNQETEHVDHYRELLGLRKNFVLHAIVVVISFIVFGLVSPVTYGFSFGESDNRDFKLSAVAGASLLCIVILAIAKVYVQRPPKSYVKTVMYYVIMGFMVSGVSYVVGTQIKKLLEKLGLFHSSSVVPIPLLHKPSGEWASY